MGAISDNITNVSTVGYKNTTVNFQSLVTKQTSATFYSAGGVQSKPRQDTGIQGLLQASTSTTDFGISGNGFFVVNEAATPTVDDQFLYTRSGSFYMDNQGYLRNTSGFYLQGWPTTSAGVVKPANTNLTIANQNIVSTDYLSTVNLNRVGGTASSTTSIGIGANLPANDAAGTTHKTDVQFFDSLGNANTMSVQYERASADNEWKMRIEPPQGTTDLKIESAITSPKVYRHIGQLEFNATDATGAARRPADGASVTIKQGTSGATKTYIFDNDSSVTNATAKSQTLTVGGTVEAGDIFIATFAASGDFAGGAVTVSTTASSTDTSKVAAEIAAKINADTSANPYVSATAVGAVVTVTSLNPGLTSASAQPFTLTPSTTETGGGGADNQTFTTTTTTAAAGTLNTFKVDISASTTLAGDVSALLSAINSSDSNFDTTNNRVKVSTGSSTTLLFEDNGLNSITIDPTGLKDSTGVSVTDQTIAFTVSKRDTLYTDETQLKITGVPATGSTLTINSLTYTFTTGEAEDSTGANRTIYMDGPLDRVLADLEKAIEANDPAFSGDSVLVRASDSPNNNTLVMKSKTDGTDYTIVSSGVSITEPDGSSTVGSSIFTATNTITVGTEPAIAFGSDGLPSAFNIAELEIKNFSNGAAHMDDDASNVKQISLDFGTLREANGMTQFGASFTPVFINQNGSRFGTFAGVTVSADGLVTALFDNGETRAIYKLPIATFVNVNGLESRTGNTWNATEASGDYTLRVADNGPAGQTIQGSLEASTVDIGEEFTDMIVVQRAYSASAKIISTADQMLEELMRVKR